MLNPQGDGIHPAIQAAIEIGELEILPGFAEADFGRFDVINGQERPSTTAGGTTTTRPVTLSIKNGLSTLRPSRITSKVPPNDDDGTVTLSGYVPAAMLGIGTALPLKVTVHPAGVLQLTLKLLSPDTFWITTLNTVVCPGATV